MATLVEIYDDVISDESQRAEFVKALSDEQALTSLLKEHDCEAAPAEARAFLAERLVKAGELSDDELSSVAGGCEIPTGGIAF